MISVFLEIWNRSVPSSHLTETAEWYCTSNSSATHDMIKIAIVGAGPGGLTLACLLLQSSISSLIDVVIFEKDASPTSRQSIGGTLDLHPPTGLAAIRKMGRWNEFSKYARFDGEEMRMCDRNGTVYVHQVEAPQIEGLEARPEIDRVRLLEILLGSVPSDVIRWGRQVKEVIEKDSVNQLRFEDGTIEGPFDLIVGADGAWSKIRQVMTDAKPRYSGICSLSGTITEKSAAEKWDSISGMVGKGNNFSFSYGKSMMGQRMGDGSLKCAFNQRRDQAWLDDLKLKHGHDQDALRRVLHEEYKDWVPEFRQWIDASTDLWCATLWELPVGHRFEHKTGLTLIADAAHLMTPFAGEGVNAAMKDALDLSAALEEALGEKHSDIDTAVGGFEESMFARAEEFMHKTMVSKEGMFAQDSPYSFFVNMAGVVAKEVGRDLDRGWLRWIPVRKLAYTIFWTMGTFGALRRRCVDMMRSGV